MLSTDIADLTRDELAVIEIEEKLHFAVLEAIRQAAFRDGVGFSNYVQFQQLRDDALSAHADDLPALLTELHQITSHARATSAAPLPDPRAPYFAHMRVRGNEGARDVLLGFHTLIDARRGVRVVDWRNAPLAKVFFNYSQGDEFEEVFGDREVTGVIEQRRILAFDEGRLVRIATPDAVLCRDADGRWSRELPETAPILVAGTEGRSQRRLGTGRSGQRTAVVTAMLDREQYAALEQDETRPLLVLGGAGCGKTTVALHRLAALSQRRPDFYLTELTRVIAPELGLVRLMEALLTELDVDGVPVRTFDQWVTNVARRLLRGLPQRCFEDTPARVVRFKRHPSISRALDAYLDRQIKEVAARLDRVLMGRGKIAQVFLEVSGPSLLDRLKQTRRKLLARVPAASEEADSIREVFKGELKRLYNLRHDRIRILGDRALLAEAVLNSGGSLTTAMMEEVIGHTRVQTSASTEDDFADVDEDRLHTADGRLIDDGTPMEATDSIDVEDFAILLELLRRKTGAIKTPSGALEQLRHLVIDEAQDLARIELAVLGQTLDPKGSITVAGDHSQQIDSTVAFTTWDAVLDAIGLEHVDTVRLETSYRCPRPIAAFAYQVLGSFAPTEQPNTVRDGPPVTRTLVPTEAHRAMLMVETLTDLTGREPQASIAIIAHDQTDAVRVYEELKGSVPCTIVLDGEFSFHPGVVVTEVAQVKGLEFDYVVIPDATPRCYPDQPESRRRMHVAATRAIHQLWVISIGKVAPILEAGGGDENSGA